MLNTDDMKNFYSHKLIPNAIKNKNQRNIKRNILKGLLILFILISSTSYIFAQENTYSSGDTTFYVTESETYFLLNDTVYIVVDGVQQIVGSLSSLKEQQKQQETKEAKSDTTFVNVEEEFVAPENPDGIQGTDEELSIPPIEDQVNTKSATLLKSAKISSTGNIGLNSVTTPPVWPQEGAVNIEKTAESTSNSQRWKINVKVEGKNIKNSTDVVLVIDDSGSMGSGTGSKMEEAKNAAKTFINQLLASGAGNTRIAVVTINEGIPTESNNWSGSGIPEVIIDFSNNINSLNSAIDNIYAGGGTNIQGGFYRARILLQTSNASNKNVVLMSDGDPTHSYKFDANLLSTVQVDLISCENGNPVWNPNSLNNNQLYFNNGSINVNYGTLVGNGGDYTYSGDWSFSTTQSCTYQDRDCNFWLMGCWDWGPWYDVTEDYTLTATKQKNNGDPAIYEAGLLINNGVHVYTIGFDVNSSSYATYVLDNSQNSGYYAATTSNLAHVYSEIGDNIAFAAQNAVLTDPMSNYDVLVTAGTTPTWALAGSPEATTADVVVTKGSVSFTNIGNVPEYPDNYPSNSQMSTLTKWQITWNLGTVNEPPGDNMWYYVDLAPNVSLSTLYPANEQTFMDFTDVTGNTNARKKTNDDFTVPLISGGKGSIEVLYYLVNNAGEPININGNIVGREYAYRILQAGNASSYFESGGTTALDYGTYSVAGETPFLSSNSITYQVHPNFAGAVSVSPSSSSPNKQVWFGYTIGCLGTVEANYDPACIGSALNLYANTTDITDGTYSWTGPDNFTSSLKNPTISNAVEGTYNVTVTYNGGNCSIDDDVNVTLGEGPAVSIEGDSHICAGSNINLFETGGEATSWLWTGPNGYTSTDQNPVFTTDISDNFSGFFVVTASNGICSTKDSIEIVVTNSVISKTGCPDDIFECADEVINNQLVKYIEWETPNFGLNCLGDDSGDNSFYMGFGLPESKWDCWSFNKVQRVGQNSGVVNLWQSNGSGDPYILSPLVFLEPALDVNMDIYAKTGENFDWTLILVDTANQEHIIGYTSVVGDNTTKTYTINIPNTFSKGAYNLKFKFSENGSGAPNKSVVDNIYFDAIILDNSGCEGGIEFAVKGPQPGYFPIISDSTITYTATYTPVSGTPIVETCSFNVTVEGILGNTSSTDATCGEDNGTITINATTFTNNPFVEYSLNGGSWTIINNQSDTTLTDLAPGAYTINLRDLSTEGNCELITLLKDTVKAIEEHTALLSNFGPYCANDTAITLDGEPSGGIYKGTGVSLNGRFTPSGDIAGFNVIWYIYEDENGCVDSTSTTIEVQLCCTLESAEANITDSINCNGGTATVALSNVGGNSPISYILNGVESSDSIFTNISAGTYNWAVAESGTDCDTIKGSITITEPKEIRITIDSTICEEALPFYYGDSIFNESGTKNIVFEAVNGCDSTVNFTLHITPKQLPIVTDTTICEDETFTWDVDGVEYLGTNGDTTVFYEGANCAADTILKIKINQEPAPIVTDTTICEDETFTWDVDGVEYPGTNGDTTVFYEGANCAADTILKIKINQEPAPIVTDTTICEDETFTWDVDGVEYPGTNGDTTVFYEGANCAADTILKIKINQEPAPIVTDTTICEDETFTWDVDGVEYPGTNGDTTVFYEGANCAADTILKIKINQEPAPIVTDTTICEDETFTWDVDGVEYPGTNGDTTVFYEGANCAADTILKIKINQEPAPIVTDTTICEDETFTWDVDGVEYPGTNGDTTVFYEGANCAADTILKIKINQEPAPIVTDTTICEDETFTWDVDGVEYPGTNGDTTVFYEGANCAADTILKIKINQEPTPIVTDTTICEDETFTWDVDGVEYLGTNGDTTVFYEGANCAADTILKIKINQEPAPIVTDTTICEDETFTWDVDGVEYLGTNGDTTVFYEGANCAADTILKIKINQEPAPIVTDTTICEDETFTWDVDGVEYPGTNGDTTVFYEGANCAADTILKIKINQEPAPIVTDTTICEDETFTWDVDGVEYLGTNGDTTVFYEGANCAADTILKIKINQEPAPIVTDTTICEDETFTWDVDGVEYLGTNGDTTVFYEGANCAADTILKIKINQEPAPIVTDTTICEDETFTWDVDGVEYPGTNGDTTVFYEGANCAADTILKIKINQEPVPIVTDTTICEDETFTWDVDGVEYPGTNGDTTVFYEGANCAADTILKIKINQEPAPIVTDTTICEDETFTWDVDGVEYPGTNGDTTVFYEGANCAADTILKIKINQEPVPIVTDTTICEDETFTWDVDGVEYPGTNGDTTVFYEGANCAADTILKIKINQEPVPIVTDTTICEDETFTWDVDGVEYPGTNGDTTVFYEGANCAADTILKIKINQEPVPIVTDTTICEDETFTWDVDGVEYPGTNGDTTVFYEGANCAADTILKIKINQEPVPIVTDTTICEDETFTWDVDGVEYPGTNGDTTVFYEGANCAADTILKIKINQEPAPIVTDTTICEDETFTWDVDGVEYPGTNGDTTVHYEGADCAPDTILVVTVTPEPTPDSTSVTICSDEEYTWDVDGVTYLGTDGDTTVHYEGADCAPDTILVVTVTPEPTPIVTDTVICSNETFTWDVDGVTYSGADGDTTVFYEGANCAPDSILELTVLQATEERIQLAECEEVTINDSTYTESGVYTQHLINAAGCDSTLTIDVTIFESPDQTIYRTACDQYVFFGRTLTESGTYTREIESDQGCTGTLTLVLTVNKSAVTTIDKTVCDEFILNDIRYTTSDQYRQRLATSAGCDSTVIINLTVLNDNPIVLTGEASDLTVECDGLGNTDALNEWLETQGATGEAEVGFGQVTWSNDFEALTPGCCNTGSDTVTFTATDDCGNSVSTTAVFTIVDNSAPTFTAPADITIYSGENCQYDASVQATGDVTDEYDICCTDLDAEFTEVTEQGSCAGEWIITRTWTLADACGNEAEPQVQVITVIDNTAPTAVCNDITVQLDSTGVATITAADIDGGSTDNCGIDTMFISQSVFYCGGLGNNEVVLTVVDECGNVSTCTATVTVEEGSYECNPEQYNANDDILTLIYCPDRTASGNIDLYDNDEGFTRDNSSLNVLTSLPDGVTINDGNLDYLNEDASELVLSLSYAVCHTVNTDICDTADVTIVLLLDSDCDGYSDGDDIDDDDDGILDIHEQYPVNDDPGDGDIDTDGDGIVDRLDIDSDDDGIPDNIEWQQNIPEGAYSAEHFGGVDLGFDYYPPLGIDSDGDGWDDQYDDNENGGQNIYYYPLFDMDQDGTPDHQDPDSDNDGIPDYIEGWDANPHDTIADVEWIGTDSDKDGLDDAYDTYDTRGEWLHGKNAIGSGAPLQDMARDTANNIRDWRDDIDPIVIIPDPQAEGCELIIPDGFSPNQDGYNDYFKVEFVCEEGDLLFGEEYPDAKIEIFNRWGNLVFEKEQFGNEMNQGSTEAWWDGSSMHNWQVGKDKLPAGTYFYILYFNSGNREPVTGSVFLNN